MADTDRPRPTAPPAATAEPVRRRSLKPVFVVLLAFALQVAVVLILVFFTRGAAPASAGTGAPPAAGQAPANPNQDLVIVDLGTYNITQFERGDPVNRRQLAVSLAVTIRKDTPATRRQAQVEAQKIWVGQLLDEMLGAMPLDAVHPTNREPLKRQIKARLNERLGGAAAAEEVVQEVILRVQAFGP